MSSVTIRACSRGTQARGLAAANDRLRRGGSWLVPAIVIGFLLGACSGDDTYLPALLADPMAEYEAEGIELIDSWERGEGRDLFFRKPTHAEVERVFRIVDQSQSKGVLEEAAAYAEENGWRVRDSSTSSNSGYGGAKKLGPGDGRLGVSLIPADPLHDPDGPRVLRIHLDFGPVRFDETTTSMVEG